MAEATTGHEIKEARKSDILLGRGKSVHFHPGNIIYRELVKSRSKEYISKTDGKQKDEITQEVIDSVKERGGRFLQLAKDTEHWEVSSEKVVRTRVKQALRDYGKERSLTSSKSAQTSRRARLRTRKCHSTETTETTFVGIETSATEQPCPDQAVLSGSDEYQHSQARSATTTSSASFRMVAPAARNSTLAVNATMSRSLSGSAVLGTDNLALSLAHFGHPQQTAVLPATPSNHQAVPSSVAAQENPISLLRQQLLLLELQRISFHSQLEQEIHRRSEVLQQQLLQVQNAQSNSRLRETTQKKAPKSSDSSHQD